MKKNNGFTDNGVTRRRFMKYGLMGAAALMFSDWLAMQAQGAVSKAKAKSVIQIWMWGGPSHLDTFDPKPNAGRDYCGPYGKPIATNVDEIQICQMLPLLAKEADKYAILRGMTHNNNSHETASYMVQTGRKPAEGIVCPGIGSVVSYFKGYNGGYKGMLPPYITVTTPQGRFSESGFLGSKYKPFSTGGDPSKEPFAVEGLIAENVTEERQIDRRALLGEIDSFAKDMRDNGLVRAIDANQQQAYSMILGDAGKAFVLSEEKTEMRDRYGRNKFGQSCLLARRLVERRVPFVTINYPGWDTHKKHFEAMNKKLPEMDKGLAALIRDISERGLLDSTIIWWGGEFGRTPKIQWEAPWDGGRGHCGKAFSSLVAGGGFKGGKVVGKTDERGETVAERPIYPWDLISSMNELLGIDPDATLPHPQGKTAYVSPFTAKEIPEKETGGLLKEIM